jgi:regulator of nonsense transcripts 2
MLADTTETRRVDRKTAPPVFDTAVPLIRRAHIQEDDKASDGKHMQFALLSKKGNKQQVRGIAARTSI